MAGDLQQTLERISRKALHLTELYNVVLQKKREVEQQVEDLQRTVNDLRKQNEELKRQNEYLTLVTTAIPSRKDVERSRIVISRLVREIDKCIAELNE